MTGRQLQSVERNTGDSCYTRFCYLHFRISAVTFQYHDHINILSLATVEAATQAQ
jgi:hypothetical protein